MMIKAESYKISSEIYCPIVPASLELFSGDGCRRNFNEPFTNDIVNFEQLAPVVR